MCVQVDPAELDVLTKATSIVSTMGAMVQQFPVLEDADFWHDCSNDVDVSLLDSVIVPFEELVKNMLSEHSDLFKTKRKRTSSKRPHNAREEQLIENFENTRQSMWTDRRPQEGADYPPSKRVRVAMVGTGAKWTDGEEKMNNVLDQDLSEFKSLENS